MKNTAKFYKSLIVTSVSLAALAVCATASAKMQVLATFPPMACFAKNVAGNAANVETLLPPDIGPHEYALAPRDLVKIANADVIVYNGIGLETWLDKTLHSATEKQALFVEAGKGIPTIDSSANPHVWLDPELAISEVKNIAAGFEKRDPANAATYAENAKVYIAKLQKLDAEIADATKPIANKRMITFHDSFPYFAKRYGFDLVGVFEEFPGKEPTPRYLLKLRDTIVKDHIAVLFSEPQYSPQLLRSMAADLKTPIVVIDPMETGEPTADLYVKTMEKNLQTIVNAMKPSR